MKEIDQKLHLLSEVFVGAEGMLERAGLTAKKEFAGETVAEWRLYQPDPEVWPDLAARLDLTIIRGFTGSLKETMIAMILGFGKPAWCEGESFQILLGMERGTQIIKDPVLEDLHKILTPTDDGKPWVDIRAAFVGKTVTINGQPIHGNREEVQAVCLKTITEVLPPG